MATRQCVSQTEASVNYGLTSKKSTLLFENFRSSELNYSQTKLVSIWYFPECFFFCSAQKNKSNSRNLKARISLQTVSFVVCHISSGRNKWHQIFHDDNVLIFNKRKTCNKLAKLLKLFRKLRRLVCELMRHSSVTRLNGLILIMILMMLVLVSLPFEFMPKCWTGNGTWLFMSFVWWNGQKNTIH